MTISNQEARRAKILAAQTVKNVTRANTTNPYSGTQTTFSTFTSGSDTKTDQGWVIEIVAEVLGKVTPEKGGAFKAIVDLLTQRHALEARGAMQLAAEYVAHESNETCEAIRTLAGDGWDSSLVALVDAARAL